jgi:hypothetical protein
MLEHHSTQFNIPTNSSQSFGDWNPLVTYSPSQELERRILRGNGN